MSLLVSIHAPRVGRDRKTELAGKITFLFQSTRPVWGATVAVTSINKADPVFQSTRPVWGATNADFSLGYPIGVSIHAPRVGRDVQISNLIMMLVVSIHAPRVGRDPAMPCRLTAAECFNPRAPCGARHPVQHGQRQHVEVSIHAPRVGRDCSFWKVSEGIFVFQSTRPVWGATRGRDDACAYCLCFNPRAPCGARLFRRGRRLS